MVDLLTQRMIKSKDLLIKLFLLTLFLITILSRLLFNGMIFDFDYHLYQPDGSVYTYMALKFTGLSHLSAAQEVIAWYSQNAEPGTSLTISFFSPETNPGVWSLGSTRVVYPLLSAPFVMLFGIPGMLVVPILSYFILLLMIYQIGKELNNIPVALVLIFALTISPTISRWYVANITDGLLATLFAITLYFLLKFNGTTLLISLSSLIVVASFVRFSAPYWYSLSIFLWLIHSRKASMIVFVISSLSVIPTLLARPDSGSIVAGASGGLIEKLIYFPVSALKVLFVEIAQLAAIDRPLLLFLIAAFFSSITKFKNPASQLFLLMALAGWFIGALNGVLGVNFRYQLPIVIFAAWTILEKINIATNRSSGNVLNIMGDKTN